MTSFSLDSIVNTSFDTFNTFLASFASVITSCIDLIGTPESISSYSQGLLALYKNLSQILYFDDFQLKLFKGFLFFLILNIFLIYISWRIYGKRICERFMKPATSKAIEELKASVSKLKLPKEHSPRL